MLHLLKMNAISDAACTMMNFDGVIALDLLGFSTSKFVSELRVRLARRETGLSSPVKYFY